MTAVRRLVTLMSLGVAGLVVAGCSGGSEPTAGTTGGPAITGRSSPDSSADASSIPVDPVAPAASPTTLPVIATKPAGNGEVNLAVSLNSVVVGGQLMTVTWTARNTGADPWIVGRYFSDGKATREDSRSDMEEIRGVADGVYLLDPVNAKRYLPARDADDLCVCSSNLLSARVEPGGAAVFEAVYQAPPASVASLDVAIPTAGTFAKVAVTR